jgi:16S rRNA (cytosine967-C5)-methyltransferase
MKAGATARDVALESLRRIEEEGAYANLVVPTLLDRSELSANDRRFVTELVYGTTRMRRACDAVVDRFVTNDPDTVTRRILRLGAYQMVFAGVPPHAAVSTTVELAPRRTRGFVNAVLRRVSSTPMMWPSDAVRLSYPDWIVRTFRDEVADADECLARMNEPAPVSKRADGYVQDLASQWVVEAVGARSRELVLDTCAGPGGKATGLASTGAHVVAADANAARARLVARNADACATPMAVVVADARRPALIDGSFDRVLVDAPCSGLGALRRRPDARWRISESDVDDLVALQSAILDASARLVRLGGWLVYSVCTITARESIGHDVPRGFEIVGREDSGLPRLRDEWQEFGTGFRLLPHRTDTDGMVLVRYRRMS